MAEADSSVVHESGIVTVFDRNFDAIVSRYTTRLTEAGSRLLETDGLRQQVVKHAYSLLDLVSAELTGRPPTVHNPGLSREIGTARASARVHPRESLQAATYLFESIVDVVLESGPDGSFEPAVVAAFHKKVHGKVIDLYALATITYIEHLLDQVQTAQQDEHRRIARELHDRVAGEASTAVNDLELCEINLDRNPERAYQALQSGRQAVQRTLRTIREVSAELRLQASTIPLRSALLHYLDARRPPAMQTHLAVTGDEHLIPARVKCEIYLLVREAIRNALIHSKAARLDVGILIEPRRVRCRVHDDGIGFDEARVPAGHGGLVSMRERAELVGGTLTVDSRPGAGTTILASIPLSGERHGTDD
ncbi:MAG: hypothetical protein AUG49_15015 [Catenulispora sp. 13_1_20CM_3_70_7]|nr:MAG: hypothetical protein AUG49_15015 [Catenulispora sp. 13_1_20CM_3_70_7]